MCASTVHQPLQQQQQQQQQVEDSGSGTAFDTATTTTTTYAAKSSLQQLVDELAATASPADENVTSPFRRQGLPWYMKSDGYRPSAGDTPSVIWPSADSSPSAGDRIEAQLMIGRDVGDGSDGHHEADAPLKKIYLPNGLGSWQVKGGRGLFLEQKCPVDRCILTGRKEEAATADAIMFKGNNLT